MNLNPEPAPAKGGVGYRSVQPQRCPASQLDIAHTDWKKDPEHGGHRENVREWGRAVL